MIDYLSIVLNGFCDEVSRHYLKDYFIRQYKEAEKQYYTADEFFFGCNTVIKRLENEMQRSLHERKRELYFILDWQKRGMNGSADTPKPLTEENHTAIADIQAELKELSKQNFPVNLSIISQNRYIGHLYWEDTLYITTQVQLAFSEVKNAVPTGDYEEEKRIKNLKKLSNTLKTLGLRGDNLDIYYKKTHTRWLFDYSDEVWIDGKLLEKEEKLAIKGVMYNIQPEPKEIKTSDMLAGSQLTENRFLDYELNRISYINPHDLGQSFNLEDYKAFLENKKVQITQGETPLQKQGEKKLKLQQIALIHAYENISITKENGNEIAQEYGHGSGAKLYQHFTFYYSTANRKGEPVNCTAKKMKNKILLFESVIPMLSATNKTKASDEVKILKDILETKYQ